MKNKNNLKLAAFAMFAALNFNAVASVSRVSSANLEVSEDVTPANYLNLTSMCSNDPAVTRRWRVRNATASPVNYTWDVYGTAQNGSGVALPGDNFFETVTIPGSPNTTRIFWIVEGTSYSKVKASGGAQCSTPPPVVPCGTNLVVNGDFEAGNTGFTSEYTFKADVAGNSELIPATTYGVGANAATYHPQFVGVGRSGNQLIVNGNVGSIKTVWSQNVNVVSGKEYNYSAYVQNVFPTSPGIIRFYAGSTLVGTVSPTGIATYAEFAGSFTATSTGALELKIVSSNLASTGNDFGIDDISFTEVCPPCDPSNLIVNGDFEGGNAGFTSEYTFKADVAGNSEMIPENTYGVGPNVAAYHPQLVGVGRTGNYLMVNGNTGTIKTVWAQSVNVIGGQEYKFRAYVQNTFAASPAVLRFYVGSTLVGTTSPAGLATYSEFEASFTATTTGAVELKIVNSNLTKQGNDFGIDDLSFNQVCPENQIPCTPDGIAASEVISFTQNNRANGSPVVAARSNAANALGAPQGTDVVNFVSLGFGGSITLKFPVVIAVNPVANELRVVETSFGNPSCASYPEKAEFEGSLDGTSWTNLGELCLDGELNIDAAGPIQYLRITDRSAASSFSGSADGYDVDGVVTINSLCPPTTASGTRVSDDVTAPNEVVGVSVFPNPIQNETVVSISTGELDNSATVVVTNFLGQVVLTEKVNVAASSVTNHGLNFSEFKSGVYFISVETNTAKEVVKVVKQ
ncbi:MAG: T9SS type A sorting domain-containing protein [Bacteroidia bacterium]